MLIRELLERIEGTSLDVDLELPEKPKNGIILGALPNDLRKFWIVIEKERNKFLEQGKVVPMTRSQVISFQVRYLRFMSEQDVFWAEVKTVFARKLYGTGMSAPGMTICKGWKVVIFKLPSKKTRTGS
ncbi:MAG: hypothetical protein A2365_01615 [Candidatus Nealsonbacteria bacterium RIFOXYB1_FULL_40_15]|uniref:Uncharacterized protein n=1 Tax=Candidatus Nealsonbacteria bacterium RIFOXYB1_FULL_40_15 TaxID=1801677 RepID=A0A1G2EPL2_9BACT|nr:MAG: hypothetical protein A2365_01615 [Candidatus Nealsonbacteria bacterium RIFOXYB1_FULL_40_15]